MARAGIMSTAHTSTIVSKVTPKGKSRVRYSEKYFVNESCTQDYRPSEQRGLADTFMIYVRNLIPNNSLSEEIVRWGYDNGLGETIDIFSVKRTYGTHTEFLHFEVISWNEENKTGEVELLATVYLISTFFYANLKLEENKR